MGNKEDIYSNNPFEHRRMVYSKEGWATMPIYPFAKSGFEPLDVTGRFAYYKSAAFKSFWDDASINKAYQLLQDGMYLDVFKPNFISGVSKIDGTVIAPGASVALPKDASVTPYSLGPNLAMAMEVLNENKDDLAESTQDQTQGGVVEPNVTLGATQIAERNAKLILGVFGLTLSNLVEQIGGLVMDCVISHATIGEVDDSTPEALKTRYRTYLAKGEEKGKQLTNRIEFTDEYMGMEMTKEEKQEIEWGMYEESGETAKEREESDQRLYKVNPYQFARMNYTMYMDADRIVSRSMGTDQQRKAYALTQFLLPQAQPFINLKNVVEDFIIEPNADGDPARYQNEGDPTAMMNAVMGQQAPGGMPQGATPALSTQVPA